MTIDASLGTALAIAAMAIITYFTRSFGFFIMGRFDPGPHVRRFLQALPGTVVVALVAPIAVRTGTAGMLAIGVALIVTLARRNELLAVFAALAVAVVARQAGL